MSGTEAAGELIGTEAAASGLAAADRLPARLAWPPAALIILMLSAGLWLGIGAALRHFFF